MPPNPPPAIVQFMPLVFFIFVFYFLLIKPQQKKQKQHAALIAQIKKNDQVITAGGVHGTIASIKDKTFILRIDDNAKMEIDKNSVTYLKNKKDK